VVVGRVGFDMAFFLNKVEVDKQGRRDVTNGGLVSDHLLDAFFGKGPIDKSPSKFYLFDKKCYHLT
jgi:hypothetical protein